MGTQLVNRNSVLTYWEKAKTKPYFMIGIRRNIEIEEKCAEKGSENGLHFIEKEAKLRIMVLALW